MTQNNLGDALRELGTRSDGEEGRKLLQDAVAAFRSALEVSTKADLPQPWVWIQINLGDALGVLGNQLEGEEGLKRKREVGGIASGRGVLSTRRSVAFPVGVCARRTCLQPSLE